ncbi:MAG: hypothetical protein LBL91_03600 [Lachnospiraceae bacterium]|jgi:hypothetical protein|nr:hypothetical protein [Lachnospiraceae bacterium]
MDSKLSRALKKYQAKIYVVLILWIILTIVFVMPLAIAITDGTVGGVLDSKEFFLSIGENMTNPLGNIAKSFSGTYFGSVFQVGSIFTIAYAFFMVIGIIKGTPKHEYEDIEHGSSDWCTHGEEYVTLSPNKGILLAKKLYLPLDKRGNTNVLVVGRFRVSENLHHLLYLMHINV